MQEKKPIDRQRDSAGAISVGTVEDKSAIVEMISMAEALYIVTEKSIYSVDLADDIDPERQNPNVPWAVQQQVLARGASDELVGRTLQKTDQVLQSLSQLSKLFYGDEISSKWYDSLHALVVKRYGGQHEFALFLQEVIPSFKFIRNMRHCVEHRKPEQRIEVSDFKINSANESGHLLSRLCIGRLPKLQF